MDQLVATLQTLPDGTKYWAEQFEREEAELQAEFRHSPEWRWTRDTQEQLEKYAYSASDAATRRSPGHSSSFASVSGDPLSLAKSALVLFLNAFPLFLNWYGCAPIETPPSELLHGIRPLLFAMLRRDLLSEGQIRMCKRAGCGLYFVARRIDKVYCSLGCAQKIIGKRYYEKTLKPARQKASAKKNVAKKRRKAI